MKRRVIILSTSIVMLLLGIVGISVIEYKGHAVNKVVYKEKKENKDIVEKREKTEETKIVKGVDKYKNKKIRVIIKTGNYTGIKHKKLQLSSDINMVITYDKNKNQVCGNKLIIKADSKYFKNGNKIYINTVDKNKGIKLDSIKRATKGLEYYGTIEVIKEGKDIIVVNEVDVEQYLYSVVPSEMPESFGCEALKVQAICARTYAYTHMNNMVYKKYEAHVDDSISYQVYNNRKYSNETKKAVDDTAGIVIIYKNELAKVFYYSTSCGYSCETMDVFGGYNIPYLKSKKQSLKENKQIKKEKQFERFILSTDKACFEKNCEWFRWNIKWDVDKLTRAVNSNLRKICSSKKNNNVKVYTKNKYKCIQVKNVGKVKSITVNKRGNGGVVKEIVIKGSKKQIKVISQNTIRQILGPINVYIKKNNSTKTKGLETLPSACFVIKKKKNNFIITGGGFGHGVGMSQWGVFELTKIGKKYNDIIDYYFENVELNKLEN